MKLMNGPLILFFGALFIIGCSKDKNMDDYQRDQLQQTIARIGAISGTYSGVAVSKLDGASLGALTLNFQAKTDIRPSSTEVSSQQSVIVGGYINFKGLTSAQISFDNGFYDDVTGNFQALIPIPQEGGTAATLSLVGHVANDQWVGAMEIKGWPEFGATLSLAKNAPPTNTSSLEIGGLRLEQIKHASLSYVGTYQDGGKTTAFKMSFINRDILPEQTFYKLFSPVRQVSVLCDFTDFDLTFTNAILDDKEGTLTGHDPVDQRKIPAMASMSCQKFENSQTDFGYDCEIQTKYMTLNLHLRAQ